MSAHHARRDFLLGILPVFLMGSLVGCGDSSAPTGTVSADNPKAGPRRKEMQNYMKNQPQGGAGTTP